MKGLLIAVLFGAQILSISGYSSAKEGRCPRPRGNVHCLRKIKQCFMDIECRGKKKCCDDGCGGYTCKPAILPPRPLQGQCTVDAAVVERNKLNTTCQEEETKFCYKTNCKRCCSTLSTCNPNPSLYMSVPECTKVICAKKTCYSQGEICVMDKYNRAKCVCPRSCPSPREDEAVCGTDKITYRSRCEMNLTACMIGDIIGVAYPGECRRGQNKVTVSPSHVNNQVIKAGKSGKITCQFEGDPVQIIWDKVGLERLPSNRMLPQDNVLVIKTVIKGDEGVYMCSGFDGVRAIVASVNVTVKETKIITLKAIKSRSVCLQDKLIGTGTRYVVRFFFNSATRLCEPFVYSGDGGNENNFRDKESCIRSCSHSASDICNLPKTPGPCFARFQRWYYNTRTAKCKMFVYGGCRGNANNFDSKKACLQACSAKHVCNLPKAVGSCNGHTARYYFDAASKSCKKFMYSGCDGNANRFHSMKRCERKCKRKVAVSFGANRTIVKPGVCREPRFDVGSCTDHSRDFCMSDMECTGKAKCCFDGCHRTCSEPLVKARTGGRRDKLGQCPAPKYPKEVCANRFASDFCQADHECPGKHKCCFNGCYYDCALPKKMPNGRPKPGICRAVPNGKRALSCKSTRHECSKDNDCFGRQKCCSNGCHRECMNVKPYKPKPGQCPIQDEIELEDCKDTKDECSYDNECPGTSKCCFTGCKMECLSPPGIKPGVCPKPWKGLGGICDLRGDMCAADYDCQGDAKCCHNGCQKDCVSPKDKIEKGKKLVGKCPKPWKNTKFCDRMGDRCNTDKDCFGNFLCCFNGCQKDCVKPVNLTKCQIEKQSAQDQLNDELPPIGVFVPSCTDDGAYAKVQCSGSVGQCWCVDERGTEITGTRIRGKPNCDAEGNITKCLIEKQSALDQIGDELPPIGVFVPSCKDDGSYAEVQCSGSVGQCWCVDERGREIAGTRIRGKPNCDAKVNLTDCQKEKQSSLDLLDEEFPPVGVFVPSCTDDGAYAKVQCSGSVGQCWCVDERGTEIAGTRIRGQPNCDAKVNLTKCQIEKRGALDQLGDELPPIGVFVPSCTDDGSYTKVQCSGSVGQCWCVDERGTEINGTRIRGKPNCDAKVPGARAGTCPKAWKGSQGFCDFRGDACDIDGDCPFIQKCCNNGCQRDCVYPDGMSPCQKQRKSTTGLLMVGQFTPKCRPDGFYASIQCHGSTGHCWCVDIYGNELPDTRIRGSPNCNNPVVGAGFGVPGRCPDPTKGKNGICDRMADECTIDSTCSGRNQKCCFNGCQRQCFDAIPLPTEAVLTLCQKKLKASKGPFGVPPPGAFVPSCRADGSFNKTQCHGSVGECWCVHSKTGEEIVSTRISVRSGERPPLCSDAELTKCQRHYRDSLDLPPIGRFQPSCEDSGKYESMQCHGSTGHCWCVDEDGIELTGTRIRGRPDCTPKLDPCAGVKCPYYGRCVASKEGSTSCVCSKFCTFEYMPICGSDGKTYGNECGMKSRICESKKMITIVSREECPEADNKSCSQRIKCSHPLQLCFMRNSKPVCECPLMKCSSKRKPVCGTDNKTYDNECIMNVHACKNDLNIKVAHGGECKGNVSDPCSVSLCSHPQHTCQNINNTAVCKCRMISTLEYDPKCASDGKTYPNVMTMENAGCEKDMILRAVKNGRCDTVEKLGTCPAVWEVSGPCEARGNTCKDDGSCNGTMKCCFDGCNRVCVSTADDVTCSEDCGRGKQCVGFADGTTRCLCKKGMIMEGSTCKRPGQVTPPPPIDPCEISLCSFPHSTCRVVNDTATCECPKACTRELMPVCGTDGKTYNNMCLLEVEACKPENTDRLQLKHQGACQMDPCAGVKCPYYGRCVASKEGSTSCVCSKFCTFEYMPICGSDGKTYGNECEMKSRICESKKMITIVSREECPEADNKSCSQRIKCSHPLQLCFMRNSKPVCECPLMKCSSQRKPVCGTDNKTYDNECIMNVHACKNDLNIKVAHDGECKGNVSDHCSVSLCSHPQHTCQNINNTAVCKCRMISTLEYDPKCASDGKTYPNVMTMENAGCEKNMILRAVKNGRCDTVEKLGTCPAPWEVSGPCEARGKMCEDDGSCNGTMKCCFDGCNRVCVSSADDVTCSEDCGRDKQCVGFADGTTRCLCKKGMIKEGSTCKRPGQVTPPPPIDPCEISLCSFPHSTCRVVNDTATCECPKACTRELVPVCGTDDKTYDNICLLEVEACKPENTDRLQLKHQGACQKKAKEDICARTLCSHPLQKCVIKNGQVTCECPLIACPGNLAPVCGSDGKTYDNNCTLEAAGCSKSQNIRFVSQGPCPEKLSAMPDPCNISLCSHPQHICQNINNTAVCKCREFISLELDPKCASDGKTYPNLMSMENAGCKKNMILKVVKDGRCEAVTKAGTCPAPWTGLNGLCNRRGSMCDDDSGCTGAFKCCYNGCQRDCVNVADNIKCDEDCEENEQCVGFPDGSTRCLCKNNTVMNMDGSCTEKATEDICARTLCSHPLQKCVIKNGNPTCECPLIACTAIYAPVCGSDGVTYASNCTLETTGCSKSQNIRVVSQGPCPEKLSAMPDPCSISLCSHPQHICQNINNTAVCKCREFISLELDPKCASDGKTYTNLMSMENAGCKKNMILKVVKDGRCEEVTTITKPILIDPCEISLCSFPYSTCRVVNDTATCECPKACTRELVPVCGTDGKTYDNMCLLEVEACKPENTDRLQLKHQGACQNPFDICETSLCSHPLQKCVNKNGQATCECPVRKCPYDPVPVCGSDGKTYPSDCILQAEGCRKSQIIKAVRLGPCPKRLKPIDICETTLCSHPMQKCVNKNGQVTCECPLIPCPLILAPVCGSDSKTYPNNCTLEAAGCSKSQKIRVVSKGPCPEKLSSQPSNPCDISLCSHPQHICQNINNTAFCKCREFISLELDPKCASDGKTYPNLMSMENAGCKKNMILKVVKDGRCEAVTKAGTCPAPWTGLNGLCNRRGSMCDDDSGCKGAFKCCYNGCQRDCVNVAENIKCDENCDESKQCVGFPDGSTRCLCKNNTVMNMDGSCTEKATEDICARTLCSHPLQKCVIKNGNPTCECPLIACTAIYAPVCGSDGVTYASNCTLETTGCSKSQNIRVVSQGPCPEKLSAMPDPCSISLCSHPQHICQNINNTAVCKCREFTSLDLDPKCASDGKTYTNLMSMENAGCKKNMILKVVKDGRCEAVTKAGTCPAPWTGLNGLCNRRGSMCDDDSGCTGAFKCCYNGCQRDCVNVADNLKCDEDCGPNEHCVGFPGGSTRCLCKKGTVMKMDGTCQAASLNTTVNPCDISLCAFPTTNCVVVNNTATCECPQACTREYKPVCGTDGKTYGNMCTLAAAACKPENKGTLKFASFGACPNVECISDANCSKNARCTNTSGSAICRCKKGFEGNGKVCKDVDECRREDAGCHELANCINTEGSYYCRCSAGYIGNGKTFCEVPDICRTEVADCHENADCINVPGSYKCRCIAGYQGDGKNCTAVRTNPCDISLCAFPTTNCVVVNNTATCECPQACTREYKPVCGTDGKTYGNMCTLAAAACKPENKETLKFAHGGPCPTASSDAFNPCDISLCAFPNINCVVVNNTATCECPQACTREYKPVCGTDGKTYGNMCTLAAAACKPENNGTLKFASFGACSAGGSRQGPPGLKPGIKPGVCPKPWKGLDGICDRRGDMCAADSDCQGNAKCCHNGCQKECVAPKAASSNTTTNPCDISLCAFPTIRCVVVNNTATCECPRACTREYKPVCGSDGKQYPNLCTLAVKACKPENKGVLRLARNNACSLAKPRPPKPGTCPPTDPHPCPPISRPGGGCNSDTECPGQSKCCHDGCSRRCMPAFVPRGCPRITKPKVCLTKYDRKEYCKTNSNCPRGQKCCFDGCIKRCGFFNPLPPGSMPGGNHGGAPGGNVSPPGVSPPGSRHEGRRRHSQG